MPSMLYLRKYSVLIIWKWPHRTIMQMVQHYLFYNLKFLLFFIPAASAFIMTDVLQGKIPTTMQKSFLFPKRISILFLNLFGWSKSSGHDLTLRKCSGGLRVYCAKIQIYPVTCEICHQLFRRIFFLDDYMIWRISFPLIPIRMENKLRFLLYDWKKNPFWLLKELWRKTQFYKMIKV